MSGMLLFSPLTIEGTLGVEGPFRNIPPRLGFWLGTRAKCGFGTRSSTWLNGLEDARKVL
jgi:hypothetical protein